MTRFMGLMFIVACASNPAPIDRTDAGTDDASRDTSMSDDVGGADTSGTDTGSTGDSDSGADTARDMPAEDCGVLGAACCPAPEGPCARGGSGLSCQDGVCVSCGRPGEPCCAGACNSGGTCVGGTCQGCGTPGAICCPGLPQCAGMGTCVSGMCRDCGSGDACTPGTRETDECGLCGVRTRVCNADCTWGEYTACSGERTCAPGATETMDCPRCGTRTRTCSSTCDWGAFGPCLGMGACEPGEVQNCGTVGGCGGRTCGASCTFPSTCTDCSCTSYNVCGGFRSCMANYHPAAYTRTDACGVGGYRVTCAPDCGPSFNSCVACPSGYVTSRFICTPGCVSDCGTTGNTAVCVRP